ncbi:MAG: DUF2306 domain-containing protein [Acidobacteriota bacterium]
MRLPRGAAFVLWTGVVLFAALAVASAVLRTFATIHPSAAMAEVQRDALRAMNGDEALLREFETRFAKRPAMTLLHVVPGALFLSFGLLQFSSRIRSRYIRFHRWSGRVLMVAAIVSGGAGLYFGVVIPFAGFGEASVIALVGAFIIVAVVRGFLAIRRGDTARHREWMIRAFAAGIAVSTVRVVGGIMQLFMPMPPAQTIVISFWAGWIITLSAAELWIRLGVGASLFTFSTPRIKSEK